jgi:MraZ protein
MLVGQGSHYEIWDLDSWKKQLELLQTGGSTTPPPGMENFSL